MFDGCSNLTTLDLSSFNTSSVTNMNGMFGYCKKLTTLDLSSFNTSAVTNMYSTFYDCTSLTTIIGTHTLEEVQTGQIKALKGMKVSLDLSYSPLLERASILAVFYGLADLTGKTAQTVTLHATAKARLTAEDIK
jgi:surface protein